MNSGAIRRKSTFQLRKGRASICRAGHLTRRRTETCLDRYTFTAITESLQQAESNEDKTVDAAQFKMH